MKKEGCRPLAVKAEPFAALRAKTAGPWLTSLRPHHPPPFGPDSRPPLIAAWLVGLHAQPVIQERKKAMTTTLHAQPYDLAAAGFYFESAEEFQVKSKALRNDFGDPIEEFEIQFIDGEEIDCDLAKAISVNQANLAKFFTGVEEWDDHDKTKVIIAVGECGYRFEDSTAPDDFEVDVYQVASLKELAAQFVDEGLFGDIPERLQFYIDFDAIARDLSVEYSEVTIAGERLIYRCG